MTPRETVILARYVKALCPQQAIDEFTPDAWHDLLGDYSLDEARAAAATVARRQPFVAPAEMIAECDRERRAALGRVRRAQLDAQVPDVPAISPAIRDGLRGKPGDPRPLRETIRSIMSRHGRPELMPAAPAAPARDVPANEQHAALDAWQTEQERPAS